MAFRRHAARRALLPGFQPSLVLLCVLGLCSLAAPAQGQSVRASLSADSVTVGERFFLTLVAEHSFMVEALFPRDSAFGDVEVIRRVSERGAYHGTANPGMRSDTVVYEIATFALDTARVPPIPVRFASETDTFAVASESLWVPVVSLVPPDAAGLRDLAPLVPFPRARWPWLVLALVLLLSLAGVAYVLYRRRGKTARPAPAAATPAPSVYETTRARLQALEARADLHDPAQAKPFYVELSELLRTYLERRLGVPALERTTQELLLELQARPSALPEGLPARVWRVLALADLAKFADVKPAPQKGTQALRETYAVLDAVEDTLRPPTPVPVGEPAAPSNRLAPSETT